MNLSEALDAALPEIPKASLTRSRPPMLDPDLITREMEMDGEPYMGVLQRGSSTFFRLPLPQWQLVQLFDGVRSYDEISQLYEQQHHVSIPGGDISSFAAAMEEQGFWYKTPQEKNLAMNERLMAQRSRRAQRTSKINLAHIYFSAWDPDKYLTWLDKLVGGIIYTPWSVLFAIGVFAFEAFVFIKHWSVIGTDVLVFYTFTSKTLSDFAEFWILLFVLGFIHETAHGLTCKHFGGEVHSMGLMFLYLAPCFYVDVTESWIYATTVQRLWTIIAGIWIEMLICGLAMVFWTNSDPGSWLYNLSYNVILITGVAVVVLNLNPLLKLDGYYFLTELIGMPELKERSTAFMTEWCQKKILRLPVEITPIPRNRAALYAVYALLSGAYSYFMLFEVVRFAYNVTSKAMAEFALIPAGALAFGMYRSRLRSFMGLLRRAWSGEFKSHFNFRRRTYIVAGLLLLLFVLPLWRDRETAYYVIEAANPVTVHSAIEGKVDEVFVQGGQQVHAGEPLLRMSSVEAATMHTEASAMTSSAHFRSFDAQMRGQSIGTAAADQLAAARSRALSGQVQSTLLVNAPIDGVVLDDDPKALLDHSASSGQALLSLADRGPHVVRLYIPYTALKRISADSSVLIMPAESVSVLQLRLGSIEGEAVTLPKDLVGRQEYKGIALPSFYSARIALAPSMPSIPLGEAGPARILGARRSLLQRCVTPVLELVRQHVWW